VLSARKSISIGKRSLLGVNTRVYDHDFHSIVPEHRIDRKLDSSMVKNSAVDIGEDVLIGANAIILKGTHIGDRSAVGAGSVVTAGDYPCNAVIAGNPARIISTA
jgi:acetyltransferase-like isoleucine patch superfamily enzyme